MKKTALCVLAIVAVFVAYKLCDAYLESLSDRAAIRIHRSRSFTPSGEDYGLNEL